MRENEKVDIGNLISYIKEKHEHDLCFASWNEMRQRCVTICSTEHATNAKGIHFLKKI